MAPAGQGAGALRALAPLSLAAAIAVAASALEAPRRAPSTPLPLPAGAALRRAVKALEGGEARRAEALLLEVGARHPIVADHADLLRMRLRVDSQRYGDAVAMRELWRHRDSPLEAAFHEYLGGAYAALGDETAARRAWERASAESDDEDQRARLLMATGRSLERGDRAEAAGAAYLRIWVSHPLSEEAADAGARLERIERRLGRSLRTARDLRRRGDALYRRRRNEEALGAYRAALARDDLGASDRRRAERQRAHTLFRLRRYPEAASAYAALPADDEIRISHARSVARAGDVLAGARELEEIGRRGRGANAARAKLLAALLLEGEGEEQRARELYTSILRRSSRTNYADKALWRLGWAAYRAGRFEEAISYLEQLARRDTDEISRLRARYWIARASERGERGDPVAAFAAIAREFPLSYYGWRARARAANRVEAVPEVSILRGRSRLAQSDLERAAILLEAGLEREARAELDRLFVRARSLDDRIALAQLYANAGDFHRPQRLMVDAYTEPLARGPVPLEIDLWWHAWPAPFAEAVQAATAGAPQLEPELVYAVMREESGYRPEVVSVSGARGLLQLMPETAQRVARGVAMGDFEIEQLFSPGVNIRLGSAYLRELLGRWSGRPSLAIASYNAGPHAVARWLDGGHAEDDEWVEDIPYDQTRGYVKRVLRSVHAYRVLY